MVIPRPFSRSIEARTWACICRSASPPQRSIKRSASVALPWSICAMMEKFLMCFINGKRKVIEWKRRTPKKEKRARQVATRPEPTIIGNCDGWNPIVGKKTVCQRPGERIQGELPGCNKDFIHNLFTDYASTALDNLCMAREHSAS